MLYDTSLSWVFLTPGVAVGAAAANVRASPTCDCGDSTREPDAPVPVGVVPVGIPAVVLTVRALTRFGSVQSYVAFTLICAGARHRACSNHRSGEPGDYKIFSHKEDVAREIRCVIVAAQIQTARFLPWCDNTAAE